jgi:methenyltetrahydromethanopterin cyclohydrolase
MISVNLRAAAIVQEMIDDREVLGLGVLKLANSAWVVDAGVKVPGSPAAGLLFAEACMGGLGGLSFTRLAFDDAAMGTKGSFWLPAVSVSVSQPHIACMAAQYAGWAIKRSDKFFAMGSGPARALYAGEELFNKLDYKDQAEVAVLLWKGGSCR